MKYFLFILFLLPFKGQSQILTTDVRSEKNIYLHALKEYCSLRDISTTSINVQFDSTVMWYDWPKRINNIDINYLDGSSEILKKIKADNGSIVLIKIMPLRYERQKFFVEVIPFIANATGKNINMSNGGGLRVLYNFSDVNKGFVFSESVPYAY